MNKFLPFFAESCRVLTVVFLHSGNAHRYSQTTVCVNWLHPATKSAAVHVFVTAPFSVILL